MDGWRLGGPGLGAGIGPLEQGRHENGLPILHVALGQLPPQHLLAPPKPHLMTRGAHVLLAQLRPWRGPASPARDQDVRTAPSGVRFPHLLTACRHLGIDFRAPL